MKSTPSDNQKLMQKIEKEIKNKVFGAFFGLIAGNALGAAVESRERGSFKEVKNMRVGGPYNLQAGYWTDGFVINTLESSLWSFVNSDSFAEAVLLAVNLGEDIDTTAAVTGQLAGAYYGYATIPKKWKMNFAKYEIIENTITKLYNNSK
jgi:ADP-ribosylglycohydrolase